jgi:aspartate-semialdehyde dehydrogenase
MPSRADSSPRVAICGASSLCGKELQLVLEDRNFPVRDFILLDESLPAGTLAEAGGEPTFIRPMKEDSFEGARFAFFTGSPEEAARNWKVAQRAGSVVIDLSGGTAEVPGAMPWIPGIAKQLPPPAAAGKGAKAGVFLSPSAATLIACTLVSALQGFSPARLVVLFFLPVSERGLAGVDELESQTAALLSFRSIEQPVFGVQVAFNLLSGYGAASRPSLDEVRAHVAEEVARYLAGRAVAPAIQLVQAPVFYGYAFASYAEFASPREPAELEAVLAAAGAKLTPAGEPGPSNVSVAGESGIYLGRIERDRNAAAGFWLWGAADNLRVAATNAVRIAEELLVS